jgi:hypothetical protein
VNQSIVNCGLMRNDQNQLIERGQDKLQWLQDQSEMNEDNLVM